MALINCPDCNSQVSSNATQCLHCGSPIADKALAAQPGETVPYSDQEVAVMLSKKKRTSHVLHLLLSIVTFGFWLIVWVLVAANNGSENAKIDRKITKGKKAR